MLDFLKKFDDDISPKISGISCDSRTVKPGNLFFALRGYHYNGIDFFDQAIQNGCIATVVEHRDVTAARIRLTALGVTHPLYEVDDGKEALGLVAKRYFNHRKPYVFAVTGTKGKTTTTYLIRHLLNQPTAVIGTIAYELIGKNLPSPVTTPNIIELYEMFSTLPKNAAVALEVSSQALDQKRIYGLAIDTAIFSNLTSDHLDYHGNREQYFFAKRKLFSGENGETPKLNLFNINDIFGQQLHKEWGGVYYGIQNPKSDYEVRCLQFSEKETRFSLGHNGKKYDCRLPMLGQHNVENALAAIAAVHQTNHQSLGEIIAKLATFPGVPGRFQKIITPKGIKVFIDYAHTEHSLFCVLESLQKIEHKNLITVFGCGGNRDKTKRAPMMHVACQFSTMVVATSDNPRYENIADIFEDMKEGISNPRIPIVFEPDRRKAIMETLSQAHEGDIVLIAGKGHETYQQIEDQKIPFSDSDIVQDSFILMH